MSAQPLAPAASADVRELRRAVRISGVFMLAVFTQGATRPGYDAWHQSISALSLGPTGWIQDVLFVVLGVALLSTVVVWRRVLRGGIGESAYPVATALTGLSLIAAAVWSQDPAPGYDPEQLGHPLPTPTGLVHLAAAGVGALSSVIGLFVMARRFRAMPEWKVWATPTVGAAVLTMASTTIYGFWSVAPSGLAGTFERFVVLIPAIWGYVVVERMGRGAPIVLRAELNT